MVHQRYGVYVRQTAAAETHPLIILCGVVREQTHWQTVWARRMDVYAASHHAFLHSACNLILDF